MIITSIAQGDELGSLSHATPLPPFPLAWHEPGYLGQLVHMLYQQIEQF
jgi:hypothetical protein